MAVGLAAAVVVIEWMWVTDVERIEQVVYDLRQAALDSDVDGMLSHMAPDVRFQRGDTSLDAEATRALIQGYLGHTQFEFIRIAGLEISVGEQSRRGTAQFRVFAKASMNMSGTPIDGGTFNSIWSLGFQETRPHVWQVNRISPVQLPSGSLPVPSRGPASKRHAPRQLRRRRDGLAPFARPRRQARYDPPVMRRIAEILTSSPGRGRRGMIPKD